MKSILPQTLTVAARQTFNNFFLSHLLVVFVYMDDQYILRCKGRTDEFASMTLLWLSFTGFC